MIPKKLALGLVRGRIAVAGLREARAGGFFFGLIVPLAGSDYLQSADLPALCGATRCDGDHRRGNFSVQNNIDARRWLTRLASRKHNGWGASDEPFYERRKSAANGPRCGSGYSRILLRGASRIAVFKRRGLWRARINALSER